MEIEIIEITERTLIGMRLQMSLENDKTGVLFQKFMPRKKEITTIVSQGVYALQQYDFSNFTPQTIFEKWACVEVSDFINTPEQMETFILKSGLYAVFIHKGTTKAFINSMRYIVEGWLPSSQYQVDNSRPHFEYLGEKYLGPNNPASEEEVWIPIK